MKKLIPLILAGALLASCATSNIQFTDLQITGVAAAAGRGALLLVPQAKRDEVKNWMMFVATKVRTLNGGTPQQLNDLLTQSIPANIQSQIPELGSLIIPAIVSTYSGFYSKFSSDHTRLVQILNDIATGVESAASQN
jgi:outer membrane PBP1 activator LpoA protein